MTLGQQFAVLTRPWPNPFGRGRQGSRPGGQVGYLVPMPLIGGIILISMLWHLTVLSTYYACYIYWVALMVVVFAYYVPAVWLYQKLRHAYITHRMNEAIKEAGKKYR